MHFEEALSQVRKTWKMHLRLVLLCLRLESKNVLARVCSQSLISNLSEKNIELENMLGIDLK